MTPDEKQLLQELQGSIDKVVAELNELKNGQKSLDEGQDRMSSLLCDIKTVVVGTPAKAFKDGVCARLSAVELKFKIAIGLIVIGVPIGVAVAGILVGG